MKIISANEMARIEKLSFAEGCDEKAFMEMAGLGIAKTLESLLKEKHLTLLVSKGNNSGDAYVAAMHLMKLGYEAQAIEIPTENRSPLCDKHRKSYLDLGGQITPYKKGCLADLQNTSFLDGLFGTGFSGEMKAPYSDLCSEVNASLYPIISIDIPSGLNGTTGLASPAAIQASHTIYLGAAKLGFFIQEGPKLIGKLHYVDFGLPKKYLDQATCEFELFSEDWIMKEPRALSPTRHKYQSGSILCFAGSKKMPGAALLSTQAAFKAGAGIVYLHTESINALPSRNPELIASEGTLLDAPYLHKAKALIIGPGLDETEQNLNDLPKLLKQTNLPCVIDASALNLIAAKKITPPKGSILTPHIQEMHRLLGYENNKPLDLDFLKQCSSYAKKHQITLLLKGAPSFAFHNEDLPIVMHTNCAALAKAGTGDVLCGIIAALLSRGHSSKNATLIGTYLHAQAGLNVAKIKSHLSLTASDLIDKLPETINALLSPIESHQEDFDLCLS